MEARSAPRCRAHSPCPGTSPCWESERAARRPLRKGPGGCPPTRPGREGWAQSGRILHVQDPRSAPRRWAHGDFVPVPSPTPAQQRGFGHPGIKREAACAQQWVRVHVWAPVCTAPVIHRHVGASAFIADYRARQLLPQESHPRQHSWLISASPTCAMGQVLAQTHVLEAAPAPLGAAGKIWVPALDNPGAAAFPVIPIVSRHPTVRYKPFCAQGHPAALPEPCPQQGRSISLGKCSCLGTGTAGTRDRFPRSLRVPRWGCEIPSCSAGGRGCKEMAQPGPGRAHTAPSTRQGLVPMGTHGW